MSPRFSTPATRLRPIVGIGLCVLDELFLVDDFSLGAERTRYREQLRAPGGMTANALVQAVALGCRAELLTLVGDDADGRFLVRELRRRGVGTRRIARSAEFPTTRSVVLVDRRTGDRRFVLADRRPIERAAPDFDTGCIRSTSIVMVDGHLARPARSALERARELGALTVGDFADPRPSTRRLLPLVGHAIVPEEFAQKYAGGSARETLRLLHARFGGTPVVTLGRRGALALVDGRFRRVRPHRVRAVDTTGAGDAFHGGFAAGLARGLPVLAALDLASRCGARACTALGATTRLLEQREIR